MRHPLAIPGRRPAALLVLLCGCASPGPASSRDLDLLKLVDPARDSVAGSWKFEGSALVTPNAKYGRVQIPYLPPREYSVTLVAERVEGANSIVLGLASEGHPFMVAIDAFERDPSSGVELIDGKSFADNETAVPGRLLENGTPATIVVQVLHGRIGVTVNGRKIVDWEGEADRLSLHAKWRMPRPGALWLGAFGCVWRIRSFWLHPISGEGQGR